MTHHYAHPTVGEYNRLKQLVAAATFETDPDPAAANRDLIPFTYRGTLAAGVLEPAWLNDRERKLTEVLGHITTAPKGQSIIIDVLRNGSSVFDDSSDRPTFSINDQDHRAVSSNIDVLLHRFDVVQIQIVQVGTTVIGSDMTLWLVTA